ncbi:MAG TPA: alpha/beta fold hydrolase, partial [Candidatus Acidoferrales bacterium]|nr:alpha/beta fold hydrolase [Candidatus Acidoferrales bacterium]
DDVAATKRMLDLQRGPCVLVGHSYGSSIISQVGVDSHVVGLVYVAAHALDVGENESALGKRLPSVLARQKGAIEKTGDGFTFLNRASVAPWTDRYWAFSAPTSHGNRLGLAFPPPPAASHLKPPFSPLCLPPNRTAFKVSMNEARNALCECQTGHLSLSTAATGGIW